MACLHNMVGRSMIDAAGCKVPLSPSGGAFAGATRDLAAHRTVRLPGGLPGGVAPGGGGMGFAARLPPLSCQAEYARIIARRMPGVMDQDLHQSKAWLANHRPLTGLMARLSSPASHRRPIVMVVAGASC
jgi:hypothetical protein